MNPCSPGEPSVPAGTVRLCLHSQDSEYASYLLWDEAVKGKKKKKKYIHESHNKNIDAHCVKELSVRKKGNTYAKVV